MEQDPNTIYLFIYRRIYSMKIVQRLLIGSNMPKDNW